MNVYLLFALMYAINLSSTVLAKKFQLGIKFTASYMFQSNLINAVVACVCLFVANKFTVNITSATIVFSAIYGFFSMISVFFVVYSYAHISITLTSIISSAGAIIIPMLFGLVFNGEPTSLRLILSAILILIAATLPIFKDKTVRFDKKFIWFLALYFVYAGLPNILSKLYTQNENVTDTLSYFFLTNVFMFIFCVIGLFFCRLCSGPLEKLSVSLITNGGVRTVMSLVGSYLSIAILALMPISVYSVLSASLSLIGTALLSRFVFKEKMSRQALISFLLALLSIIVRG